MFEREGAVVNVVVQTNDINSVGQACVLTTVAGTAIEGKAMHIITLSSRKSDQLVIELAS